MTMHWKGLWALFRYHGEVIDAFIPVKKSKSGKRFGFVRYNRNAEQRRNENNKREVNVKSQEFGRIEVGESSLRSNYDPNKKDEEVVKVKNTNIVVQGHVEEEQLWNLQRCLVGTTATCCDSKSLFERIVRSGLWEIKIRRMQGRLDEEMISGIRIETMVGERAKNGYNNRARKEVSNMGFTIDELGLKNEEGAQEEQQISEEGMGLARILTVTEKKKRDWALRKQKGKGIAGRDDVEVNASLSDSDISNRKKVILMEARNMWEVGKKRGFSVWGDK
ncbi:hypothetical protein Gotur_025388 [Gossypium turneri]